MLILRRATFFLIVIGTLAYATCICAQEVPPQAPEVRLEPHQGKTSFYLGEPIQLDLIFENHTGQPATLNTTEYGDLSEKVEITPAKGWMQWQTPSGHDYMTAQPLHDSPIRVAVRLDEGFIFREPGSYRVRVTTGRARVGNAAISPYHPVTTNEVEIELQAMPADMEKEILRSARFDFENAPDTREGMQLRANAMKRLATLQGNDALAEKIKLLEDGEDDFRQVSREAFASTHDLKLQLDLLEKAWTDPAIEPQYDMPGILDETRALLAGRNLQGWQMVAEQHQADAVEKQLAEAHHADMLALLNSMPKRTGENRGTAAFYLVVFGGLNEAERARGVEYAVEEFAYMEPGLRDNLLESARPPLRDPRLVPTLTSMLEKQPTDTYALTALIAISPSEGSPWAVKTICASKGNVLLDVFKEFKVDRLPETDACLAEKLRVPPATLRAEFEWKQAAEQAARFATPAILPALKEGWQKPTQNSAALAILMREAPAEAVAQLNKELAAGDFGQLPFYESNRVFEQLQQPFPDEVLAWLRERVAKGTDNEAGMAAFALSQAGSKSDAALIEARLQRLRVEWKGREQEVAAASNLNQPSGAARRLEIELVSALGRYGPIQIDAGRRDLLGQGCMSSECHFYLH